MNLAGYRVFTQERRRGRKPRQPSISIARTGQLYPSVATWAWFDGCAGVELSYHEEKGHIALRPVPVLGSTHYPVHRNKQRLSIPAERFLREMDIPHDATQAYRAFVHHGVVIIELNAPYDHLAFA